MAKAKVVVTIAGDAYKIAQNIWKAIKGSPNVKQVSSKTPAKTISKRNVQNKIQANNLKIANERSNVAKNLRTANEKTKKIDLKSHPSLKNGKIKTKTKTKPTNGTKIKTKTTNGTKIKTPKKVNPWKTTSSTQAQNLRAADVAKGIKITSTNAVSGNIEMRGAKKLGNVVTKGSKKFIKTKTGKLIAIGGGLAGVHYIGKAIDKKIAATNGAAATTKPPKQPLGPPSVYPPTKKPPTTRVADDDLEAKAPKADPKVAAKLAKPKTFEQKLKAKFVKFRGGEPAFGKKGSDAAWKTEVLNMREGSEGGYTYTDQQNYDKIIAERKELASASKGATKKKRGGVIKRNKGGPVRGVGKALRGYGNNSIYSNKMY